SIDRATDLSRTAFGQMVRRWFTDAYDCQTLGSTLAEHGAYARRFFHRAVRERVARRFAQAEIDLQELATLLSIAWGYDVHIYGASDAIYRITDQIYEQTLIWAIGQHEVNQYLRRWFEEFSEPRTCALCDNEFRVIDLPDWIYFGSAGFQHCCFRCPIIGRPKKAKLMQLVPEFVASCRFTPRADATPINYAFTSRLSGSDKAQAFRAYGRMGGIQHVKAKFGSWFKGLAETGALPRGVHPTARGVRCLATDGHVCHSLDEQRIDNWLSANHLSHQREPQYAPHPTLNASGRRRADWKVGDTFIEYFGLVGDVDYERKMDEKMMLSAKLQIDMVAIYPPDLDRLDERLGFLVNKGQTPQQLPLQE
ncbi:MAG TPA: hypothetical protein VM537_30310, partial [Anaerolineae bacterium]|nr:hypothetical protein [Anaerolineae bacterium]